MEESKQNDSQPSRNVPSGVPNSYRAAKALSTDVESAAKALRDLLTVVISIAAVLTAGGFIVVNSHLAKFTDIHGYSVDPKQYIAAGVGLLLPPALALMLMFGAYYVGRGFAIVARQRELTRPAQQRKVQSAPSLTTANLFTTIAAIIPALMLTANGRRFLIYSGLVLYTILFSLLYGTFIYGDIPHYLGGGRPETITLVFKDADTLPLFKLSPEAAKSKRTRTLLLLAELTDGLLVLDTNSGSVVALKNESIMGIVDDTAAMGEITPTPTALPTSSLIPIATP